jgi:hypothetical protein
MRLVANSTLEEELASLVGVRVGLEPEDAIRGAATRALTGAGRASIPYLYVGGPAGGAPRAPKADRGGRSCCRSAGRLLSGAFYRAPRCAV